MNNAAGHNQVQPYLFFEGRCAEALDFYATIFDAEVTGLLRVKDSPESPPAGMLPPGSDEKVMHADFTIGGTRLMASDGMCSGNPRFEGISLSFTATDEQHARNVFETLADGGEVRMPLGATFFSPCFGIVGDRFGVAWMINVPAEDA